MDPYGRKIIKFNVNIYVSHPYMDSGNHIKQPEGEPGASKSFKGSSTVIVRRRSWKKFTLKTVEKQYENLLLMELMGKFQIL